MNDGAPQKERYPTRQCGWIEKTDISCPNCGEYNNWMAESGLCLCLECSYAWNITDKRPTKKEIDALSYVLQHLHTIRTEYEKYSEEEMHQKEIRRRIRFMGMPWDYFKNR